MKSKYEILSEKIEELKGELAMIVQLLKILELDDSRTYDSNVITLAELLEKRRSHVVDKKQVYINKLSRL